MGLDDTSSRKRMRERQEPTPNRVQILCPYFSKLCLPLEAKREERPLRGVLSILLWA